MTLPSGMTSEKLRELAKWFDTVDLIIEKCFFYNSAGELVRLKGLLTLDDESRSNQIQLDLSAWADEIDSVTDSSVDESLVYSQE